MILVDTSVWIDYFRGASTSEADKLDSLLGVEQVVIGDLILAIAISTRSFNTSDCAPRIEWVRPSSVRTYDRLIRDLEPETSGAAL
jgi:predicted nucleic acid-binding protein